MKSHGGGLQCSSQEKGLTPSRLLRFASVTTTKLAKDNYGTLGTSERLRHSVFSLWSVSVPHTMVEFYTLLSCVITTLFYRELENVKSIAQAPIGSLLENQYVTEL